MLSGFGKVFCLRKKSEKIFEENKQRVIQNPEIIPQELNSIGSLFNEKEIISLVRKRLDENSAEIFNRVFSSVIQEIKARGQCLEGGIVDIPKVLHPTIEKSFPRGNDLAETPPKKRAWWKFRKN